MPFIGNPDNGASNAVWMDEKKEAMDLAIIAQDWATALPIILEAIEKAENWTDLEMDLPLLYDRLAICYAGLGMVAEMNAAREKAKEVKDRINSY